MLMAALLMLSYPFMSGEEGEVAKGNKEVDPLLSSAQTAILTCKRATAFRPPQ